MNWITGIFTTRSNPDPQSISNNAYKQWGPPVAITSNSNPSHTHSYTVTGTGNLVSAANAQAQNYGTVIGIAGGISLIPNQYPSQYLALQLGGPFVSAPTGTLVGIAFTDANGQIWALSVDGAYAQIMMQISQYHSSRGMAGAQQAPNPWPTPAPSKMVEGDFSFDEMEEAELLILELEGGRDNSHSQDQEAISASQA
jgi:hypothetical protein